MTSLNELKETLRFYDTENARILMPGVGKHMLALLTAIEALEYIVNRKAFEAVPFDVQEKARTALEKICEELG